ncbi:MAG: hypothetical protein MRJ92_02790 [Nitrospira sp.]|nr:hypothetical protein [Nitrospira sp.]
MAQHESRHKVDRAATATRTDTPIMETPYSIQVVPQQVLRDQQAGPLKNVSSVNVFLLRSKGQTVT